jgi:hypothetical protein
MRRLVPLTAEVGKVFQSWFDFRLPGAKHGIFVADGDTLLGGVLVYDTDGAYCLFEHFALNPAAPPRLKHAVAEDVFRAAQSYATINAKVAFAAISFQGGVNLAKRVGFNGSSAELVTFIPGTAEEPPRAEQAPPAPTEELESLDEPGMMVEEPEIAFDEPDELDDLLVPDPTPEPAPKKKRARKKATKRAKKVVRQSLA